LGNPKHVEQQLRGNTLDAVISDFTAHTFQRQAPFIAAWRGHSGLRIVKFRKPRHVIFSPAAVDMPSSTFWQINLTCRH
jgi:hypothetical protein